MEIIKPTPITKLGDLFGNELYIKRDDMIPFSFGGNKVRKAVLFFEEIDAGGYDTVVTYGSGSSNHCRIVANMAAARNMECIIISTDSESDSINRRLVEDFGGKVIACAVEKVAQTIDETMNELAEKGKKAYFIQGGGHGNTGTRAYDLAYDEIKSYEDAEEICFDYIFLASGTGTTQAGLVCGKRRTGDDCRIVGISIARSNPRGGQVVIDSIRDYTGCDDSEDVIFDDGYICGGYGKYDADIEQTIVETMRKFGIPLDYTYTGKAFTGMKKYLAKHGVTGKRILFIHTGGTPIYCDWIRNR